MLDKNLLIGESEPIPNPIWNDVQEIDPQKFYDINGPEVCWEFIDKVKALIDEDLKGAMEMSQDFDGD